MSVPAMPTNMASLETENHGITERGGGGAGDSSGSRSDILGVAAHTGREARNLAEKHRRDKLNASIQELAAMVPHVSDSTKRPDKTGILRFAAHGLRLHYVFGKSVPRRRQACHNQMPAIADEPHLTDVLTHMLDSFFITLTCHGQIVVISTSIEQLLGHCQSDLYGQNILSITHPDDQAHLLEQLIPRDMEALFRNGSHSDYHRMRQAAATTSPISCNDDDDAMESDGSTEDYYLHHHNQQQQQQQPHISNQHSSNSTPPPYQQQSATETPSEDYLSDIDRRLRNDRRTFTVRLARAGTRSEAIRKYELVKFDGCFRRSDFSCLAGTFPIVSQLIRRTRNNGNAGGSGSASGGGGGGGVGGIAGLHMMQHDVIAQAAMHGISGNDVVLVAMARIIRTTTTSISRLVINNGQMEYRTRHLIDGRIVDTDQRIGLVAGYMKDEVCNLSPFSFMHQDDVRWVIVALRRMYDNNCEHGESVYRLLTRNGHFIYLESKGFMDVSDSSNNVYSFICVNTLLDEEEGKRRLQQMKNKFSTIIKTKIPSNSLQDVPASDNPQQLERIVFYLIDNLQTRHANGTGTGCGESTATQADNLRYTKTPPLSLVPPEPASVKNSISQSVSVVNVTAARNLQKNLQNQMKSPRSNRTKRDLSLSPANSLDLCGGDDFGESMNAVSPSSIHTKTNTISGDSSSNHNCATTATATERVAEVTATAAGTLTTTTTITANARRPSVLQLNTQAATNQTFTCTSAQSTAQSPTKITATTTQVSAATTMAGNGNGNEFDVALAALPKQRQEQQKSTTLLKRLHPASGSNWPNANNNYNNHNNCVSVINNNRNNCANSIIISPDDDDDDDNISPAKRSPSITSTATNTTIPLTLSPITHTTVAAAAAAATPMTTTIQRQPAEIHAVISHSLDHIDQSLQSIQENARTLCQQHARLVVTPTSPYNGTLQKKRAFNHKLDAIFVEHQRQAEQLINIKNEYDVHLQQQQQHQQSPLLYQQLQLEQSSAVPPQLTSTNQPYHITEPISKLNQLLQRNL